MSAKNVELAVRMTGDVSDAADAFDAAGDAAVQMAQDIDRAADMADSASSRLDGVAAAAEGLDSNAAKVTGSLGALSSGFELVGLDQYAGGLQAAAQASDFLSGAGQAVTLVLGQQRAATIAAAVATKVTAAATKAYSIAQGILNAVLAANPVGAVVLAIVALVAGLILAYKKSETFRSIVQAVMTVVKTYVQTVVDIVTTLVEFVGDKAPKAWTTLKDGAVAAASFIADKVGAAFDTLTAPIQFVIDKVQQVLDLIANIKLPDLPSLGDLFRTQAPDPATALGLSGAGGAAGGVTLAAFNVRELEQLLRRNGYAVQRPVGA